MSTLTARRPIGQFSTLRPRRPKATPFGFGLLADEAPAPANRVAGYFSGRVAPAPLADPDVIPTCVQFIRITSGASEGTYRRAEEPGGLREWEIVSNGKRRRLAGVFADKACAAGRVAILEKAPTIHPADPITPAARPATPHPFAPSPEDRLWALGLELGLAGIGGRPLLNWSTALRLAFEAGLAAGEAERLERMADAELQARWDGMVGDDDEQYIEAGEYAEARMALPGEVRD